jgi:hypothetical protein
MRYCSKPYAVSASAEALLALVFVSVSVSVLSVSALVLESPVSGGFVPSDLNVTVKYTSPFMLLMVTELLAPYELPLESVTL